jgi:hypothetical protein
LPDDGKTLPRGPSGTNHHVKTLFIPRKKLAQFTDGSGLIHIREKDDLSSSFLDARPNCGGFTSVGDVHQRKVFPVLNKVLDELSAIVCGFVVDDDDFPHVALFDKVLVYLVQCPSFQISFFVVARDNDR